MNTIITKYCATKRIVSQYGAITKSSPAHHVEIQIPVLHNLVKIQFSWIETVTQLRPKVLILL